MKRVILTAKKNPKTTISIVGGLIVCAVLLAVFAAGFGGGAAYTAYRPMMVGNEHTGLVPNPVEQEKFIGSLGDFKSLKTGAPDLFGADLPKVVRLDMIMREASEKSGRGPYKIIRQEIGDCVSHGWARGVECALAIEYMTGQATDWWPVSPESVYAGRIDTGDASMSDGWYGSAAAKATQELRGVLFKKPYESGGNKINLTVYSGQRAKQAGNGNWPKWLKPISQKHLVKNVALITSVTEAKVSLDNGYPIPICTQIGFAESSPGVVARDKNGMATPSGRWGHCWCAVGYFTLANNDTVFITYNNWGEGSTSGPGGPQNIPPGAFGIHERVFAKILAERDSYAVSGPNGFERRDIDHDTWANWSKESEEHFAIAP